MATHTPSLATQARAMRALQEGRRDRVVRYARLAPASQDDAHALRFSVEDALNTMDFADCGRLVLVRRLSLRGVPPRTTPALMSRLLEQAWRALMPQAVHALHPRAEQAPAVYFSSRTEARTAWLKQVAGGEPVQAWFWPRALPELQRLPGAINALPAVAETLLQDAARDTLDALRTWPDALLFQLAALLPATSTQRLFTLCTQPEPIAPTSPQQADAHPTHPPTVPNPQQALPPAIAVPIAQRLAQRGASAEASGWLAALWLHPVLGSLPTPSQVQAVLLTVAQGREARANLDTHPLTESATVAQAISPQAAEQQPVTALEPTHEGANPATEKTSPSAAVSSHQHPRRHAAHHAPTSQLESGLRPNPERKAARSPRVPSQTLPWLANAAPTRHGGLLFLVNVLAALRFDTWLAAQPREACAAFVNAWFTQALRHPGAAPNDPQHAWFAPDATDAAHLSNAVFTDGQGTLAHQAAQRLWFIRVRRALRRRGGLSLRELVQRPGWVSSTPTHFDIVMPLEDVDLRLRRVGLDSDPGWCPWLGRIVAFHFVSDSLLPEWPPEAAHG